MKTQTRKFEVYIDVTLAANIPCFGIDVNLVDHEEHQIQIPDSRLQTSVSRRSERHAETHRES